MTKNLTILIPLWWRDKDRVYETIEFLQKNLTPKKIIIAGPASMEKEMNIPEGVEYLDGNLIVSGMSKEAIAEVIVDMQRKAAVEEKPNRAGWLMQQFIKLGFGRFTDDEEYLVWDADTHLIDAIDFKINGKPKFVIYDHHMHIEYLPTINRLFGKTMKTQGEYTFVNHYALFETNLVREMLDTIEQNPDVEGNTWWEKCIRAISIEDLTRSGFSEFETYGEYVITNHPDAYEYETGYIHLLSGKKFLGENPSKEILDWVSKDFKTVSFEGYDNPSEYWMKKTMNAYRKGKRFKKVHDSEFRRWKCIIMWEAVLRKLGIKS